MQRMHLRELLFKEGRQLIVASVDGFSLMQGECSEPCAMLSVTSFDVDIKKIRIPGSKQTLDTIIRQICEKSSGMSIPENSAATMYPIAFALTADEPYVPTINVTGKQVNDLMIFTAPLIHEIGAKVKKYNIRDGGAASGEPIPLSVNGIECDTRFIVCIDNERFYSGAAPLLKRRIRIFAVMPFVLTDTEVAFSAAKLIARMQSQAMRLSYACQNFTTYRFSSLLRDLNRDLAPLAVDVYQSNILAAAFIELAGMREECGNKSEQRCGHRRVMLKSDVVEEEHPTRFTLICHFSLERAQRFVAAIHKKLNHTNVCEVAHTEVSDKFDIHFDLLWVAENIDRIKSVIKEMLSDQRVLRAYQLYSQRSTAWQRLTYKNPYDTDSEYTNVIRIIKEQSQFGCDLNYDKTFLNVLLAMAGVEAVPTIAYGERPDRYEYYVDGMLDVHHRFDIPVSAVNHLLEVLNRLYQPECSNHAPLLRLIGQNLQYERFGEKSFCMIAIDMQLVTRPDFLSHFKNTLISMVNDNPAKVHTFRSSHLLSRTVAKERKSVQGYIDEMNTMLETQFPLPRTVAQTSLVQSITRFSAIISDPSRHRPEWVSAQENVHVAIGHVIGESPEKCAQLYKVTKPVRQMFKGLGL